MQKDRKFVWTRDAETTESFDLRRSGLNCDKEFEVDIVFSCRFVFTRYLFSENRSSERIRLKMIRIFISCFCCSLG